MLSATDIENSPYNNSSQIWAMTSNNGDFENSPYNNSSQIWATTSHNGDFWL